MDATSQDTNVSETDVNATENPTITETETQETDDTDSVKRLTHDRVLQESKGFKARAQAAEKALLEREEADAKDQGKWKELYEGQKVEAEKRESRMQLIAVRAEVSRAASAAGCLNIDALMAVGDSDLLTWDTETDTAGGGDAYIDAAKMKAPYLFQVNKAPVVNSAIPGGNPGATPFVLTNENLNKATPEQRQEAFRNIYSKQ